MDLKELASSVIEKARKLGADEAEAYVNSASTTEIEVINQAIESFETKNETGIGLRVFKDRRLGFSSTNDLEPHSIDDMVRSAVESSRYSEEDPHNALPDPAAQTEEPILMDGAITKLPDRKKIELALEMERAAYAAGERIKMTEKAVYSDGTVHTAIVNSRKVGVAFSENFCGGHIEVIARDGDLMENGHHSKFARKLKDFDAAAVGKRAADKALELLNARSIASQRLDIIMSTDVAVQFLEALAPLFSSDFVQKRKSAFAGKLRQKVASGLLTLTDDGRLPGGLASAPYDAEGSPTQETRLIDGGVLTGFLFDRYTSLKAGGPSTGNAVRGGYRGLPSVGTTNLFIGNGSTDPLDMVRSVKNGLYLTRVMGMHTVNPISAEFSVGASGIMIVGGKRSFPVRGATMAGTLLEMLMNIDGIGNDLEFRSSTGSPTLLIRNVQVSGRS